MNGFPKLEAQNPYYRSPQMIRDSIIAFYGIISYQSLIVHEAVSRTVSVYSLRHVQHRYIWLSALVFNLPLKGSPGTIYVKFDAKVSGWLGYKMRRNVIGNFNRLCRLHDRYRQTTTDDRWICDSKYPNVTQSRSGKKN